MNVLYAVSFPADPARVDRVRSSIEQCLDASPLAPETHADLARAASSLLTQAAAWADDATSALAVHIEATFDAYAVTVDATRPDGATRRFASKRD